MPSTTNTLQAVGVSAERALFGQPKFSVIDTGTHAALDANTAPLGNQSVVRLFVLNVSASAAPATALTLQVKDGSTVIWQCELAAAAPFAYEFDFSNKPLRGSNGATLHATLGDPGVGIVATVTWTGDFHFNTQGT